MKKLLFGLAIFVSSSTFAQWKMISGNGNVQKEKREVGSYTGIHLSGNMNVEVEYGNSGSITVEADENLLPYIETKVENGNLVVKTQNKTGIKSKSRVVVHAYLKVIHQLKVSGSGNITGAGDFDGNGKTEVAISGSGNIDMQVANFNELRIAISGSGDVRLKGENVNNIDAKISGSGNIDCSGFSTNDVFASVSGSGNIRVDAKKSIGARVSGSGNIYYKGPASRINLRTSGSGKIIKV